MDVANFIEFANLYLAALDLCAIAVLMWYTFRPYDGERVVWLSAGLTVLFFGHTWSRIFTWWDWFTGVRQIEATDPIGTTATLIVGLLITTIGLVWVLRIILKQVNVLTWYAAIAGCATFAGIITALGRHWYN
jgi:hypothetical protein